MQISGVGEGGNFMDIADYFSIERRMLENYALSFKSVAKPNLGSHQFKIIFIDSRNRSFEMETEVNFK
jgi:hypothetical protein